MKCSDLPFKVSLIFLVIGFIGFHFGYGEITILIGISLIILLLIVLVVWWAIIFFNYYFQKNKENKDLPSSQ